MIAGVLGWMALGRASGDVGKWAADGDRMGTVVLLAKTGSADGRPDIRSAPTVFAEVKIVCWLGLKADAARL